MSPILAGVVASGISGHLTPSVTGSYEAIATTTVGPGGATTVTFSGIPQTYKHLQFRCFTFIDAYADLFMRPNGVTSGDYQHQIGGTGSAVNAGAFNGNPYLFADVRYAGVPSSSVATVRIIDILDYTNTNKYKTIRTLYGVDGNGSGEVGFWSGANYNNTNAITSFDFVTGGSSSLKQYSHIALYGIKGS